VLVAVAAVVHETREPQKHVAAMLAAAVFGIALSWRRLKWAVLSRR
jgi:hypothetical protein